MTPSDWLNVLWAGLFLSVVGLAGYLVTVWEDHRQYKSMLKKFEHEAKGCTCDLSPFVYQSSATLYHSKGCPFYVPSEYELLMEKARAEVAARTAK